MLQDLLNTTQCSCGRDHTLETREYVIEENAYLHLPALLTKLGYNSILAVYDSNTHKAAFEKLSASLPQAVTYVLQDEPIHADEYRVEEIGKQITKLAPSVVLAVGGGVVCDIVRYATFEAKIPFIAVPTAASVDGFVSGSAAMTFKGAKVSLPTHAPVAVVADLATIAAAPKHLAASGVGDMLSKFISIADWRIGHLISGEYYCSFIADFELKAVEDIVEAIPDIKTGGLDGIRKLIEGLLISGIAMQMAKITRPASSFEHHFSHYLELVPLPGVNGDALHGEKVGIGTVIAAKYYPLFVESMKKIFEQDLPNRFDVEAVVAHYQKYSQGLADMVREENTPTVTSMLDKGLLQKNWNRIMAVTQAVPTAEQMAGWLAELDGYYDYKQIGLTAETCLDVLKICCYIRNRFTMLRIVRDFDLNKFDALLI
ncbi:MAG: iron-containing alcohol dehydrogenase [Eubacteriales bacterium]